jgi:hypothetical protein
MHRPAELYVRVPEVLLRLCVAGHRHLRDAWGLQLLVYEA